MTVKENSWLALRNTEDELNPGVVGQQSRAAEKKKSQLVNGKKAGAP